MKFKVISTEIRGDKENLVKFVLFVRGNEISGIQDWVAAIRDRSRAYF